MRDRSWLLVSALALAACGSPGDDAGAPDATAGTRGITLAWEALPTLVPAAEAEAATELTEATVRLANVRLVGDAAPGDERTARQSVQLHWTALAAPPDVAFELAPAGLYAQLEFQFTDSDSPGGTALELRGRVAIDGNLEPVLLRADRLPAIDLPLSLALGDGDGRTIVVAADLGALVDVVAWQDRVVRDGVRVLEPSPDGSEGEGDGDGSDAAELVRVRAALPGALHVTIAD